MNSNKQENNSEAALKTYRIKNNRNKADLLLKNSIHDKVQSVSVCVNHLINWRAAETDQHHQSLVNELLNGSLQTRSFTVVSFSCLIALTKFIGDKRTEAKHHMTSRTNQ